MIKKEKSVYDYIKGVRSGWVINPRTRVKEDESKNKKKRRQKEKKIIKNEFDR